MLLYIPCYNQLQLALPVPRGLISRCMATSLLEPHWLGGCLYPVAPGEKTCVQTYNET